MNIVKNTYLFIFVFCTMFTVDVWAKNKFVYFESNDIVSSMRIGFGEGDTPNVGRTIFTNSDLSEFGDEFDALLHKSKLGLIVVFYSQRKCDKEKIFLKYLNVAKQDIVYQCKCDASGSQFVVTSEEDRHFVNKHFWDSAEVPVVGIDTNREVVFNAYGFRRAWRSMGGSDL